MEHGLCTVSPLGQAGHPGSSVSDTDRRPAGLGCRHGGWHVRQGSPTRHGFPKRQRPPDGEAKGHSRGGLTTKILAATDRRGNLIRYLLLPGNAAEVSGLLPLTDGIATNEVIADKAYDSDHIRKSLAVRGIIAVIPSRSNRRHPYPLDKDEYRTRHLVENYFSSIKDFRRIATRYDKTDSSFAGMVDLVAAFIAIR